MKQIVGSTLKDTPASPSLSHPSSAGNNAGSHAGNHTDAQSSNEPVTNFVSDRPAADYARMYAADGLPGGHVIMLGQDDASREAALGAVQAFPGEGEKTSGHG